VKTDLKILAVIPARGGSKGIPRKNIKLIGGEPLICHTIKAALKSKLITRIIVSTEDSEIAEISSQAGAEVPFIRDQQLAGDETPCIPDILVDANSRMRGLEQYQADIVLLLEPTYPFRSSSTIDKVITALIDSDTEWAVTVSSVREHPLRMRKMDEQTNKILPFIDNKDTFVQRQGFNELYMLRGAVYAAWTSKLTVDIKSASWQGVLIDPLESIDIDEPFDFKIADALMNARGTDEN